MIFKVIVVSEVLLLTECVSRLIKAELGEDIDVLEAASLDQALNIIETNQRLDMLIYCSLAASKSDRATLDAVHKHHPSLTVVVPKDIFDNNTTGHSLQTKKHEMLPVNPTPEAILSTVRDTIANKTKAHSGILAGLSTIAHTDHKPASSLKNKLGFKLTPSQFNVLKQIQRGNSNKEIARTLHMAEGTVKIHCMAIYRELGVANRTQAAIAAERIFKENKHAGKAID